MHSLSSKTWKSLRGLFCCWATPRTLCQQLWCKISMGAFSKNWSIGTDSRSMVKIGNLKCRHALPFSLSCLRVIASFNLSLTRLVIREGLVTLLFCPVAWNVWHVLLTQEYASTELLLLSSSPVSPPVLVKVEMEKEQVSVQGESEWTNWIAVWRFFLSKCTLSIMVQKKAWIGFWCFFFTCTRTWGCC